MKSTTLQTLRSLQIPVKRWGNSYRVQIKNKKGRKVWVSDISRGFYQEQLVKQYPEAFGENKSKQRRQRQTKLSDNEVKERRTRLQKAIQQTEKKKENVQKIVKLLRKSALKSDNATLNAINSTSKRVETYISRFERIRRDIIAPADKKMLLHFKDHDGKTMKTYHLQDRVINIHNLFMNEENQYSSGADVELNILPLSTVEVEWIDNPKRSRSERKSFFRYILKTDELDLSEFQVFHEMELIDIKDVDFDPEKSSNIDSIDYPCFLFALLKAGVPVKIIKQISQSMFHYGATVDFIKKTAKRFNLYISVKQYYRNEKTGRAENNISYYGEKSNNVIKLGSVGQHLFAIKPTKITKAALDNQHLIDEKKGEIRAAFIIKHNKPCYKSSRIHLLDSYEVISYLYHNRETHLYPITQRNMPHLLNNKYQEVRSLEEEDFGDNNFKPIGRLKNENGQREGTKDGQTPFKIFVETKDENGKNVTEIEEVKSFNVVYFDFETLVQNNCHVPYCVSYCLATVDTTGENYEVSDFSKTRNIYGFDCAEKFLSSLPEKSYNLLWAHNAGFDCRFLLKLMTFSEKSVNMIDSGTKVKQTSGFYKGRTILIKDTMSFLASPLSKLPNMFKGSVDHISLEKECFPHKLINAENYQSLWSLDYLDSYEDKKTLITNAEKIGAIITTQNGNTINKYFDCQKYATHYCNRDVDVLQSCFEAFRRLVKQEFNLEVYRFLSVSSLSIAYQHNEGCFDDCYEMNSVLLGFLREATVGGRVMTRDNKKWHTKHKLADFDAVSLYPSAMFELPGYAKGKAKIFKNQIPCDADFYVARVRIESIGIERHFPLQSFYDNGSRNFTNEIVGRTMVLGKQALEDLVQFQNATYTVIEGVYWNEGFNDQICKTIEKMFNARLMYKQEKNPMQNVLKLMMNSSYGKLLMKPIVKQKIFVSGKKKIDEYTQKKIHKMISRTPINDNLALFEEHKALSDHFSPIHLGIQVLDSSKHIMNRVMCLAEDIDAKIWYQDTDSMHIDYDAVERLADAFKSKYNTELIGEQMGQFHVDFELEGSAGNIFAVESFFLGKKSYLDILACDGNDVTGMHIRMKGIPSKLLEGNAKEKRDREKYTYDAYMKLFNAERMKLQLEELCPISINSRTQSITKRTKFERTLYFK